MTSVPTWLAVLVPVLAAAVAGGLGLLGIILKNRSDARAAANAAEQVRAVSEAQWVRERRERAYTDFLSALRKYDKTRPTGRSARFSELLTGLPSPPLARVIDRHVNTQFRAVWQELEDSVASIQTYGSDEVRRAVHGLLPGLVLWNKGVIMLADMDVSHANRLWSWPEEEREARKRELSANLEFLARSTAELREALEAGIRLELGSDA